MDTMKFSVVVLKNGHTFRVDGETLNEWFGLLRGKTHNGNVIFGDGYFLKLAEIAAIYPQEMSCTPTANEVKK